MIAREDILAMTDTEATATATASAAGTATWSFAAPTATMPPGISSTAGMIVVPGSGMIIVQRYEYTGRELASEASGYYFRYRVYGPELGQFFTRDPIRYLESMAPYAGVFARHVGGDPRGLWYEEDHQYLCQVMPEFCSVFNFKKQDEWPGNWPGWPWQFSKHFQDLSFTERLLLLQLGRCDKERFELDMHRMQDYFAHYVKGFRWYTLGHGFVIDESLPESGFEGTRDQVNNVYLYVQAAQRTKLWLGKWKTCCCRGAEGGWTPVKPLDRSCTELPPALDYDAMMRESPLAACNAKCAPLRPPLRAGSGFSSGGIPRPPEPPQDWKPYNEGLRPGGNR